MKTSRLKTSPIMDESFSKSLTVTRRESLNHLRKVVQQHIGQSKTYKDECEHEIEQNSETIDTLKSEILKKRMSSLQPNTDNEYLMRQALPGHHTGSSVFREWEPRDIQNNVDNSLCDLQNNFNLLRNIRIKKAKYLQKRLQEFDDAVNDVVFLQLEGPAGDSRCLALENHISEREKKRLEAEMLNHTYEQIRNQLTIENLSNENTLCTLQKLLRHHEDELEKVLHSSSDAIIRKDIANANACKMEVDLHNNRKERSVTLAKIKKENEEQKYDFAQLWRNMQAYFLAHETIPMGHSDMDHSHATKGFAAELSAQETLECLNRDFELLTSVTGSKTYCGILGRFESQQDKHHHLAALTRVLEAKKLYLLARLKSISTEQSESIYRAESAASVQLRTASGDVSDSQLASSKHRVSVMVANTWMKEALCRVRQLLEYIVDVLAGERLVVRPSHHREANTMLHLPALLTVARRGAAALMRDIGAVDPAIAQRDASAAHFLMTHMEMRLKKPRTPLSDKGETSVNGFDEGDTTGDDAAVPSRGTIKRQAELIVLAKQKHSSHRKRRS